jgi:hypothetical protein
MHDALMVGEYPAIPTRFQAHKCCDPNCGKDMMKQISIADVQKAQFDVGSRFFGEVAVHHPRRNCQTSAATPTSPKHIE